MICWPHSFGKWEDVKVETEVSGVPGWPFPFVRQVIRQQRRCSRCNLVKTRTS